MEDEHQEQMAKDFNPRSREGSDRLSMERVRSLAISIHAPAKGATPCAGSFRSL